jgi:hypothetical protein
MRGDGRWGWDAAARKTSPEKTRQRQCVMAKISAQPEVEDKGNKVISLTFSFSKTKK